MMVPFLIGFCLSSILFHRVVIEKAGNCPQKKWFSMKNVFVQTELVNAV
uniref:Uncharacterized protein n=1 Tax=Faecalibaculum rodentium TaxID=1702221 RepID=A0A140DWP3_9FIRM|nr:hypothetical protein AALO17_19360 [Faecalibaculum rodentium]